MSKRRCAFGPGEFLQPLADSSDLLRREDWQALRGRLQRDGYLFLRGALPAADVRAARRRVLESLAERGNVLDPTRPLEDGVLCSSTAAWAACRSWRGGTTSRTRASCSPSSRAARSGASSAGRPAGRCDDVRSFDFKWLRAMPEGSFTGAHFDRVYMGRGTTDRLLTCWVPFGHNPVEMGTVAVCEGSHALDAFAPLRRTYGALDHERDGLDGSGWFTEDAWEVSRLFGGQWRTADFEPGDVLTFSMLTLHMSTTNTTGRARISADVRWQPACEPVDPRYVGAVEEYLKVQSKAGAWNAGGEQSGEKDGDEGGDETTPAAEPAGGDEGSSAAAGVAEAGERTTSPPRVTMEELRARWGFPVGS